MCDDLHRERGQATVELLAVLPLVLAVGAIAWQLVLAGQAAWLTADAARAGARADAVGADPGRAARSVLPRSLERGLHLVRRPGGGVRVEADVPLLLRRWSTPIRVAATASLGGRR
jgi:hypothetical protein